jgi:flagellar assembly factor FliW
MLSNSCEIKPVSVAVVEPSANAALAGRLLGREVNFPAGLLGFPDCHRFALASFDAGTEQPSPFFVLSCRDREVSFLVIHPDLLVQNYCLPLPAEVLDRLGIGSECQVLPLLIVTLRERVKAITVNLQGPLAVGIDSGIGVQLVVEEYPLRYPLIVK